MEKNPTIHPHVGAKKPIYSNAWCNRFQVDSVFSLPQNKSAFVVFELEKFFGLVGYPTIFHTDNGNELTARLIVDMIADINPSIITVSGMPHSPRD